VVSVPSNLSSILASKDALIASIGSMSYAQLQVVMELKKVNQKDEEIALQREQIALQREQLAAKNKREKKRLRFEGEKNHLARAKIKDARKAKKEAAKMGEEDEADEEGGFFNDTRDSDDDLDYEDDDDDESDAQPPTKKQAVSKPAEEGGVETKPRSFLEQMLARPASKLSVEQEAEREAKKQAEDEKRRKQIVDTQAAAKKARDDEETLMETIYKQQQGYAEKQRADQKAFVEAARKALAETVAAEEPNVPAQ
jgi:hypothetical protein